MANPTAGALATIAPAPLTRHSVLPPGTTSQRLVDDISNNAYRLGRPAQEPAEGSSNFQALHDQPLDDVSSEEEPSPQGLSETNSRTNGKEFYGPAATLVVSSPFFGKTVSLLQESFLLFRRYRYKLTDIHSFFSSSDTELNHFGDRFPAVSQGHRGTEGGSSRSW